MFFCLVLLSFDTLLTHFYFWLFTLIPNVKSSCIRPPPLFGINFLASKGGLIRGILRVRVCRDSCFLYDKTNKFIWSKASFTTRAISSKNLNDDPCNVCDNPTHLPSVTAFITQHECRHRLISTSSLDLQDKSKFVAWYQRRRLLETASSAQSNCEHEVPSQQRHVEAPPQFRTETLFKKLKYHTEEVFVASDILSKQQVSIHKWIRGALHLLQGCFFSSGLGTTKQTQTSECILSVTRTPEEKKLTLSQFQLGTGVGGGGRQKTKQQ